MIDRPIRWGLLGTGNITRKLLRGAAGTSTAEVVAVGSRDSDRAAAFAAANGIARAHGSYEELLADPEVDAIYISLPNGLHHGWTMHALAEPNEVIGVAAFDESGVDRRFTGILRFPSGPIAELSSGFTSNQRGLEAIGRDGSARATDPWQSSPATIWRDGVETVLEPADPYRLELEDMAAAIRGERPALLGRADALGQARVIDALYRSAPTGMAVRL